MQAHAPDAFLGAVRQDPLFAAEGLDLENAERALDEIETRSGELSDAFAAGSFMRRLFFIRYPIARYAIPVLFLRAFIAGEKARRQILAHPTRESGETLVTAWEHALRAFRTSVARYRLMHRLLLKLEKKNL